MSLTLGEVEAIRDAVVAVVAAAALGGARLTLDELERSAARAFDRVAVAGQ